MFFILDNVCNRRFDQYLAEMARFICVAMNPMCSRFYNNSNVVTAEQSVKHTKENSKDSNSLCMNCDNIGKILGILLIICTLFWLWYWIMALGSSFLLFVIALDLIESDNWNGNKRTQSLIIDTMKNNNSNSNINSNNNDNNNYKVKEASNVQETELEDLNYDSFEIIIKKSSQMIRILAQFEIDNDYVIMNISDKTSDKDSLVNSVIDNNISNSFKSSTNEISSNTNNTGNNSNDENNAIESEINVFDVSSDLKKFIKGDFKYYCKFADKATLIIEKWIKSNVNYAPQNIDTNEIVESKINEKNDSIIYDNEKNEMENDEKKVIEENNISSDKSVQNEMGLIGRISSMNNNDEEFMTGITNIETNTSTNTNTTTNTTVDSYSVPNLHKTENKNELELSKIMHMRGIANCSGHCNNSLIYGSNLWYLFVKRRIS